MKRRERPGHWAQRRPWHDRERHFLATCDAGQIASHEVGSAREHVAGEDHRDVRRGISIGEGAKSMCDPIPPNLVVAHERGTRRLAVEPARQVTNDRMDIARRRIDRTGTDEEREITSRRSKPVRPAEMTGGTSRLLAIGVCGVRRASRAKHDVSRSCQYGLHAGQLENAREHAVAHRSCTAHVPGSNASSRMAANRAMSSAVCGTSSSASVVTRCGMPERWRMRCSTVMRSPRGKSESTLTADQTPRVAPIDEASRRRSSSLAS